MRRIEKLNNMKDRSCTVDEGKERKKVGQMKERKEKQRHINRRRKRKWTRKRIKKRRGKGAKGL